MLNIVSSQKLFDLIYKQREVKHVHKNLRSFYSDRVKVLKEKKDTSLSLKNIYSNTFL